MIDDLKEDWAAMTINGVLDILSCKLPAGERLKRISALRTLLKDGLEVYLAAERERSGVFDVILDDMGPAKLDVMILVRAATGLRTIEAKWMVEAAPVTIRHGLTQWEARALQERLILAGAKASIRRRGSPPGQG